MRILTAILLALACIATTVQAQTPLSVRQLVQKSDFIGLVQANTNMIGKDFRSEWRQEVFLLNVTPIKGALVRNYGHNQFPFIRADHAGVGGYPTQFSEPGEYLVFLQAPGADKNARWTTLAAYRAQYYPDGYGAIPRSERHHSVGLLASSVLSSTPFVIPVTEVQKWLAGLMTNKQVAPAEADKLNSFFRASLQTRKSSLHEAVPTYEGCLALAQKLAEAVAPGMTRAEVEKIFPQSDGGAFGSNMWRYYFGSEVMIDVPYDTAGGPFQPQNKVNGPLRVYRSMMHYD